MGSNNILENLEFSQDNPLKTMIAQYDQFTTFRIALGKGLVVPPHQGDHSAFFLILKGKGVFTRNEEEFELGPNQFIQIGKNDTRGIQAVEDLVILAVRD